jgi:hypothetical protein
VPHSQMQVGTRLCRRMHNKGQLPALQAPVAPSQSLQVLQLLRALGMMPLRQRPHGLRHHRHLSQLRPLAALQAQTRSVLRLQRAQVLQIVRGCSLRTVQSAEHAARWQARDETRRRRRPRQRPLLPKRARASGCEWRLPAPARGTRSCRTASRSKQLRQTAHPGLPGRPNHNRAGLDNSAGNSELADAKQDVACKAASPARPGCAAAAVSARGASGPPVLSSGASPRAHAPEPVEAGNAPPEAAAAAAHAGVDGTASVGRACGNVARAHGKSEPRAPASAAAAAAAATEADHPAAALPEASQSGQAPEVAAGEQAGRSSQAEGKLAVAAPKQQDTHGNSIDAPVQGGAASVGPGAAQAAAEAAQRGPADSGGAHNGAADAGDADAAPAVQHGANAAGAAAAPEHAVPADEAGAEDEDVKVALRQSLVLDELLKAQRAHDARLSQEGIVDLCDD